ncbi:MAG: hypothetical protein ACRDFQ_02920, partial [Anaerolineales bacterium]
VFFQMRHSALWRPSMMSPTVQLSGIQGLIADGSSDPHVSPGSDYCTGLRERGRKSAAVNPFISTLAITDDVAAHLAPHILLG